MRVYAIHDEELERMAPIGYLYCYDKANAYIIALLWVRERVIPSGRQNIVNSLQACETMECTRQNLSYLVKTKQLTLVICGIKENFYTKGAIQKILE